MAKETDICLQQMASSLSDQQKMMPGFRVEEVILDRRECYIV